MLKLLIANKNYSSWSMRPWLVLKHFRIEFEERSVSLLDANWDDKVGQFSPAKRVPVLLDGDFAVWDSMAIIEYLAERFPEYEIWPGAARARARARSLCAEMHSGFSALRSHWPMNISADLPGHPGDAAVGQDITRVCELWQQALADSGGPFLFGPFGAADAMYAPIVMRFATYHATMPDAAAAYAERVRADHAVSEWCAQARLEDEYVAADEPFRSLPAKT